jgi:hypothetical protein
MITVAIADSFRHVLVVDLLKADAFRRLDGDARRFRLDF